MITSHDPVSVLEGMYAAEAEYLAGGQSSFAPLAPFFAEDVVLHQADALPYGGTWHGHEGLTRFFGEMSRTWATFDLLDQTYLATTSPLVVLTRVRATARATGRALEFPILQTITVEHGRITEVRPFYWDTAAIAAACGQAGASSVRQPSAVSTASSTIGAMLVR